MQDVGRRDHGRSRRPAAARAHRCGCIRGCGTAGRGPRDVRGAHRHLPRPPGPRDDPDLRGERRARRRRGRDRRPSSCACRATSIWPTRHDRDEAEELYAEQAQAIRDAIVARRHRAVGLARAAGAGRAPSTSTMASTLDVRLPAHRLMPVALVAPEQHLTIVPVCGARTLAEGLPAAGDRVRPAGRGARLPAARRPRAAVSRTSWSARTTTRSGWPSCSSKQEASVQRFLELNGEDTAESAVTAATPATTGACAGGRSSRRGSSSSSSSRPSCRAGCGTENAERDAILRLLQAQARGDAGRDAAPAWTAATTRASRRVRANARSLKDARRRRASCASTRRPRTRSRRRRARPASSGSRRGG